MIVHSVSEYEKQIDVLKTVFPYDELLYRGQANYGYPYLPSLYRLFGDETTELETIQSAILKTKTEKQLSDIEGSDFALYQHYGVPTRILDVTRDPLVALYFACEKHDDIDGSIGYAIPHNVLTEGEAKMLFSSILQLDSTVVGVLPIDDFIGRLHKRFNRDLSYFRQLLTSTHYYVPTIDNQRIRNQQGVFIIGNVLKVVDEYSNTMFSYESLDKEFACDKFIVPYYCKEKIRTELALRGITSDYIYPDPEKDMADVKDIIKLRLENSLTYLLKMGRVKLDV